MMTTQGEIASHRGLPVPFNNMNINGVTGIPEQNQANYEYGDPGSVNGNSTSIVLLSQPGSYHARDIYQIQTQGEYDSNDQPNVIYTS